MNLSLNLRYILSGIQPPSHTYPRFLHVGGVGLKFVNQTVSERSRQRLSAELFLKFMRWFHRVSIELGTVSNNIS